MNTPEQEILIAQQSLRESNVRLADFLNHYWQVWEEATPAQIAGHNAVKLAIDEAVAKMEILKETLK
jgi:hypothetical protein